MGRQPQPKANIKVKVQPRASADQVVGYRGDVLLLRVTAPPVGGQANLATVSLLAGVLGVAKSRVQIVRGHTSRDKLLAVESLTTEEVQRLLSARSANPHS